MKKLRHTLTTFFLCLSLLALGQAHAQVGHDAHQGHGSAKLSLNHGKQWQTDEPLRKGMEALRSAFAAHLHAIHEGKMPLAEYKNLGEETERVVGSMVAECKLEPEADAMLHLVITDMIAGADIMLGKAKGEPRTGALKVVSALNSYGRYFDHPKWNDLK